MNSFFDSTIWDNLCFGDTAADCGAGAVLDGDYNNSGNVELSDLNLVMFNWKVDGSILTSDWINQRPADGTVVGIDELNGVLFNWGSTASVATVPEPAVGMLAVLGLLVFGILRR